MSRRNQPSIECSAAGKSGLMLLAGLLCLVAQAAPAAASAPRDNSASTGPPAAERQGTNLPQVTIDAQRQHDLEHRAHVFVTGLTRTAQFSGASLAIWRTPLCFLVAGLPKAQGELLLGYLSAAADSAGARLAGEHCQPNFLVLLTSRPDALLEGLKARHPLMFGAASPAEISRFVHPSTSQAVRVWRNTQRTNRDGVPVDHSALCGGLPNTWINVDVPGNVPVNCTTRESALSWGRLSAFLSVIVAVDTTRAGNVSVGQLADYISLVGLADIDPDEDVGDAPTILHLFAASGEPAPPGLTPWDRAFLLGLYHSDQTSHGQRRQIEMAIARRLSH
ncbi:MAG TPA: hypothetical protein VLX90_12815 [Steroidobacteraceae bacterium]|nr:hypothetical protein [Steroidobacteraceae bacterium]